MEQKLRSHWALTKAKTGLYISHRFLPGVAGGARIVEHLDDLHPHSDLPSVPGNVQLPCTTFGAEGRGTGQFSAAFFSPQQRNAPENGQSVSVMHGRGAGAGGSGRGHGLSLRRYAVTFGLTPLGESLTPHGHERRAHLATFGPDTSVLILIVLHRGCVSHAASHSATVSCAKFSRSGHWAKYFPGIPAPHVRPVGVGGGGPGDG